MCLELEAWEVEDSSRNAKQALKGDGGRVGAMAYHKSLRLDDHEEKRQLIRSRRSCNHLPLQSLNGDFRHC